MIYEILTIRCHTDIYANQLDVALRRSIFPFFCVALLHCDFSKWHFGKYDACHMRRTIKKCTHDGVFHNACVENI